MYTPVKPSFTIYKWGVKGSSLHRFVFVMINTRKYHWKQKRGVSRQRKYCQNSIRAIETMVHICQVCYESDISVKGYAEITLRNTVGR